MKDELISFDTAVLAQKEGFHINVFDINSNELVYLKDGTVHKLEPIDVLPSNKHILDNIYCHAPTQSLLQRWLREVHNISIWVSTGYWMSKFTFDVEISYIDKKDGKFKEITPNLSNEIESKYSVDTYEDTYELALEVGLQEALKLIK